MLTNKNIYDLFSKKDLQSGRGRDIINYKVKRGDDKEMKGFEYETLDGQVIELSMKNIHTTIFNYYIDGELIVSGTRREIANQLNMKIDNFTMLISKTKRKSNKRIKHILKIVEVR